MYGYKRDVRWHGTHITTLRGGTELPVEKINYLKDSVTVTLDVTFTDSRKGWVVLGVVIGLRIHPCPTSSLPGRSPLYSRLNYCGQMLTAILLSTVRGAQLA